MLNIINADIFRVRKGTALYGVIGGIFALFLLMAVIFKIISLPVFNELTENGMSIVAESGAGIVSDLEDAQDELGESLPNNGGEFMLFMFTDASNGLALFLLPLIISVFGADFATGAFRNLLSYESGRLKIYIAKLITTLLFTVMILLAYTVLAGLLGCLFFGFGGFGGAFFLQILTILAIQMPVYLALICLGHCILAFSKKCSYAIAIYIVGLLAWAFVIQMVALIVPGLQWIMQFDLMSVLNILANYKALSTGEIAVPVIFASVIFIVTLGLGMYRYKTTDFDSV